ncbi:MAG: thioesterase family protein [Mycobacterium sp.]
MAEGSTPRFADAMKLRPVDGRPGESSMSFEGDLDDNWAIGPKIHGGVMVALCAKAAREAYGGAGGHPVAVSANFLSAPDPGPVRLLTTVRKKGRRIGLVDVELVQGERACVHAVVTLGDPEHDATPLFSGNPVTPVMALEPPADVLPIGPGHSAAEINHLARGCDIRPLVADTLLDGQAPAFQVWVRPREGEVDELFALMCGDISLPVPYAVGRRGWAPTVQLTAYLRGLPADGWLRVLCTATQIGQDWFDEDHTVVDSTGRIIVQTRQLALVPPG